MIPYLVSGLLCILFSFIGTKIRATPIRIGSLRKKNKDGIGAINAIFYCAAICCPCILAALRDKTVGTDVQIYGDSIFNMAAHSSFSGFWTQCQVSEPLFKIVAYCLSRSQNIYLFYFVLQLLVVLPIFDRLIRTCKKNAWLGMLIYYLWLYGYTLNLMRQSIAIAIIIWGSKYIIEQKPIHFFAVVVVATGFHLTGTIGIVLYLVAWLIVVDRSHDLFAWFRRGTHKRKRSDRFQKIKRAFNTYFKLIIICGTAAVVIIAPKLITFISSMTGKYQYQVNHIRESVGFSKSFYLLVGLSYLIAVYVSHSGNSNKQMSTQFYSFSIVCGMILYYMISFSPELYRVSLYFTSYFILYIPEVFQKHKKDAVYLVSLLTILILFMGIDYNNFVLKGWNEIYPYRFRQ